ncbi:hypothetical protein [Devosia ginsengisoli]|uniref:Uncharacterized protein n=1 Tax=Devosia ginsengisoli TaxID=400770 RepID=A0A5B8LUU7_9HYPH|nr:hypothetical protein [Devosia ginsengisoli]QDZ11591.1 hypothetical protein FPZ08_12980 [Devosia ginsengisoli]
MSQAYPDALFERVRDHLERAAAILHNEVAAQTIRDNIEEAVDLALECAYRPLSSQPLKPVSALNVANDNAPDVLGPPDGHPHTKCE